MFENCRQLCLGALSGLATRDKRRLFRAMSARDRHGLLSWLDWEYLVEVRTCSLRLLVPSRGSQLARLFSRLLALPFIVVGLQGYLALNGIFGVRLGGMFAVVEALANILAVILVVIFSGALGLFFVEFCSIRNQAGRIKRTMTLELRKVEFGVLRHQLTVVSEGREFPLLVAGLSSGFKKALAQVIGNQPSVDKGIG